MQDINQLKRILSAFALLALLIFAGCSGGNEDENSGTGPSGGPPPPELVDTWSFVSVTVNGNAASLDSVMEWVSGAVGARFTIYANNAYSYEEINNVGAQLYSEIGYIINNGNQIEVIITDLSGNEVESFVITYVISSNTLTISLIDGSNTIVFTLTN